jgi:hypothetical protein
MEDSSLLPSDTGSTTTVVTVPGQSVDTSNFYTKSQVDSSLSLKEDKTDLINNYYNKSSIDGKVATLNTSIGLKAKLLMSIQNLK